MSWDEDVAAGAAIEWIRASMVCIENASAALTEAVRHAKDVPELEQAGVVERVEQDAQAHINETWAALMGVMELARNAMATKETSDEAD